ncbi:MAG: CoA transferase, partial [Candidatus Binatia bacterium]
MQGLEGIRVLELGHLVSAAYATKLIADLGADVIKVEEPDGDHARARGPFPGNVPDPEQSGLFLALNTNKRSVTLDLRTPQGKEQLRRLVSWANILIHNYSPALMAEFGIDYAAFHALNPRLVMCSITPFGLSGPYKDYKAYEITVAHGGGWAWLSPGTSEQSDLSPLKAFGHQCGFQSGLAAATTALAAYYRALDTDVGEHIDLSAQEYVASFTEQNIVYYTYLGKISSRLGRRLLYPWGIHECQDGLIFLLIVEQDQWQRLIELMGNPEWASWEIFKDQWSRGQNSDILKPYLDEWISQWRVEDLFCTGQERRICFSPVFTMADLPKQAQLRTRNFFVEVNHPRTGTLTHLGPPYQLHEPWWQIRRPAPLLGEHNKEVFAAPYNLRSPTPNPQPPTPSSRLPLEGVRIADFSWVWAGPFCSLQLAHLGAEVIRVESRARQDAARRLPLGPPGIKPSPNTSGYFNQWSQGKKSLALNLSKPEALAVAKKLIQTCDVVLENFANGVMEELGLGYQELKKIKPDIIMASICGYGHSGPQQDYMGYG